MNKTSFDKWEWVRGKRGEGKEGDKGKAVSNFGFLLLFPLPVLKSKEKQCSVFGIQTESHFRSVRWLAYYTIAFWT